MKHNYANGGGAPFSRPIYKSRYLSSFRKSGVVTLLICLFSFHFVCFAQESRESGATEVGEVKQMQKGASTPVYVQPEEDSINPLYIGDSIPEEFWNYKMPIYLDSIGRDSVCLADFRGDNKVLIIDFWPTWCAPCIKSVLWLDSVTRAKEYKNIQFISLCVGETLERLHAFIDRTQFSVPTLFDFSYLTNRMLARYKEYLGVIMIKEGKLWGAVDPRTLTEENLDRLNFKEWEDLTISFVPERDKIRFAKEVVKEVSK